MFCYLNSFDEILWMFRLDFESQIFSVLSEVWTFALFSLKLPKRLFPTPDCLIPSCPLCLTYVSFYHFLLSLYISFFSSAVSFFSSSYPPPISGLTGSSRDPAGCSYSPGCLCAGPPSDGCWDKAKSMEPGPQFLPFRLRKNFCSKQLGRSSLYNYSNTLFKKHFLQRLEIWPFLALEHVSSS